MLAIKWLQSEREVNLGGWLNIRKYQNYAHNYRNANEVSMKQGLEREFMAI